MNFYLEYYLKIEIKKLFSFQKSISNQNSIIFFYDPGTAVQPATASAVPFGLAFGKRLFPNSNVFSLKSFEEMLDCLVNLIEKCFKEMQDCFVNIYLRNPLV